MSLLNSSTHRFLDFHRETCAPSSHSLCSLSSTLQRTQPSVKLLSLQDGRIENSCCTVCGQSSQDTSHLLLRCPGTDSLHRSLFGNFLFLSFRRLVQALESFPASGTPWIPPCLHPSEGVGKQQQDQQHIHNFSVWRSARSDNAEKPPESLFVVLLNQALREILQSICGGQATRSMQVSHGLPVMVSQFLNLFRVVAHVHMNLME